MRKFYERKKEDNDYSPVLEINSRRIVGKRIQFIEFTFLPGVKYIILVYVIRKYYFQKIQLFIPEINYFDTGVFNY